MNIFEEVKKLNLSVGKYVVIGSGVMSARGIRDFKDVDILVARDIFDELRKDKKWREEKLPDGGNVLKWGVYELDADLHCSSNYHPETEKIIKEAEIINGIPFMPLKELIKFKTALGREKDFKDIELIKEFLNKNE